MNINNKPASLRSYKISIPPNSQETILIQGKTLRLINSNVPINFKSEDGSLDFTLLSGDEAVFEEAIFYRFRVFHLDAAAQLIDLAVGNGGRIGSAKLSGVVSVSSGTVGITGNLTGITNPVIVDNRGTSYGASYKSNTGLAANTPELIFSAAANVNGAIIHAAAMTSVSVGNSFGSYIAKAIAPVSNIDGDVILSTDCVSALSTTLLASASLKVPIKIAAGKGLFYINAALESAGLRHVLYTLL